MYLIELRDAFAVPALGAWPVQLIWTDPPVGSTRAHLHLLRENWQSQLAAGAGFVILGPDVVSERSQSEIANEILSYTQEGDLVVDPFCGTGTTGFVALAHGRNFYGCDSDPEMVRRSRARLETGVDPG